MNAAERDKDWLEWLEELRQADRAERARCELLHLIGETCPYCVAGWCIYGPDARARAADELRARETCDPR